MNTDFYFDFVTKRERESIDRFGVDNRTGKLRSSVFHNLLVFSRRLGSIGLIMVFFISIIIKGKIAFQLFNQKSLVLDHGSNKICSLLLEYGLINSSKALEKKNMNWLLLLSLKNMLAFIKFHNSTKPKSMLEFNAVNTFVVSYVCAKYIFKSYAVNSILVVDDLSPSRVGFLLAAAEMNVKVGLFRMSDEPGRVVPFFPVDVLFVWTLDQVKESTGFARNIAQHKTKTNSLCIPKTNAFEDLRIGIAFNAKTREENVKMMLQIIELNGGAISIKIRPHPNSNVSNWNIDKIQNVTLTTAKNPLENFLSDVDVVFCGYSSILPQILAKGVPVIHSTYLDSYNVNKKSTFSTARGYRYVEDGLVYPMQSDQIDLDKVWAFYKNPHWINKWKDKYKQHHNAITVNQGIGLLLNQKK